jgi:hypothetical protein
VERAAAPDVGKDEVLALPSASLMLLVSVGVVGVATLEVRTYPTFTSSLETWRTGCRPRASGRW